MIHYRFPTLELTYVRQLIIWICLVQLYQSTSVWQKVRFRLYTGYFLWHWHIISSIVTLCPFFLFKLFEKQDKMLSPFVPNFISISSGLYPHFIQMKSGFCHISFGTIFWVKITTVLDEKLYSDLLFVIFHPWDAHRVIGKTLNHVQPLESSNHEFESSRNIIPEEMKRTIDKIQIHVQHDLETCQRQWFTQFVDPLGVSGAWKLKMNNHKIFWYRHNVHVTKSPDNIRKFWD